MSLTAVEIRKGRGVVSNHEGRFQKRDVETVDDGWYDDRETVAPRTVATAERAKTIISYNQSPDIPFDRSINPYRGCEHGCVYCFARPSHSYLDLSPGLDFETRLFYKVNAAELLRAELAKKSYRPAPITLGINTDAWQPIERKLGITRSLLEILLETRHPVGMITKSTGILRDLDLLAELAAHQLTGVHVSLTSLDENTKRSLEPRTAGPQARLNVIRKLADAGVPVGVNIAPVIPAVTDHELEALLEAARDAGATRASYILLRLPHEVAPLFREWLAEHHPLRAKHVMNLIQASRGGKDYDAAFGKRMRGEGHFADLLAQRFRITCKRLGLNRTTDPPLRNDLFRPPGLHGQQQLF